MTCYPSLGHPELEFSGVELRGQQLHCAFNLFWLRSGYKNDLGGAMSNPKNPYPHEIAYDQHVWLPRANDNYVAIDKPTSDRSELQTLIENLWPEVTIPMPDHPKAFEQSLMPKLSPDDIKAATEKCTQTGLPVTDLNILRMATHFFPDMRVKLGTSQVNPPADIHWMQRSEYYIGDTYSSNMIVSTLAKRNMSFEHGKKYLDFGCSSGSLVRALKVIAPGSAYHGADPLDTSIKWANANIPDATFVTSQLRPPLPFEAGLFDGITAVSIWSHLGENEALVWFDEMHRVLKLGGWLCFTTHGRVSVSYYNKLEMVLERRLRAVMEGLINNDFVFEETYLGESPEGIDATGYGNAYFTREWVFKSLSDKWELISHDLGMNQRNQDVYLLRAKVPSSIVEREIPAVKQVPLSYSVKRWVANRLR
jgi:SAM-dependent methyltransferase